MSVDLFPESMDSKDSPEDKFTFCSTRFRRKIREVAGLLTLLVCELPAPAATSCFLAWLINLLQASPSLKSGSHHLIGSARIIHGLQAVPPHPQPHSS